MERAGAICRRSALSALGASLLTPAGQARAATAVSVAATDLRARTVSEFDLASAQGRPYRILVSTPDGPPPTGGLPVIYVLDGHGWFGAAVEIARMREHSKLDAPLIVGVGYPSGRFFDPARSFDFTPPGATDDRFDPASTGGADQFLAFLTGALKPKIAADHAVDPARQALFGHSLGGLFALYALFHAPRGFDTFIAASPSVGFGGQVILREAAAFRPPPVPPPNLLVTMGGLEVGTPADLAADYRRWYEAHPEARGGQSVDDIIAQTFSAADAAFDRIGAAREMTEQLARAGVRAVWAEFDGEEHTAAGISALNRGVPFALRPGPGRSAVGRS